MLKSHAIAALATGVITSTADAAVVVTSISGTAHIDGYTTAAGFERDEYDFTESITAIGQLVDLSDDAASGTSISRATANGLTRTIDGGFQTSSANFARGTIGSSGANAVGRGTTNMMVRFTVTSSDALSITGRLQGGMSSPGGRSYSADGSFFLFNPFGALALRRNYLSWGSMVDELIPTPVTGEWRIEFSSSATAVDYGGGGFSGGWIDGGLDISITSVPGPGAALLGAAPLLLVRRRRRYDPRTLLMRLTSEAPFTCTPFSMLSSASRLGE